jgi:hypothetical protein
MSIHDLVEINKAKILTELFEWAETFEWELDADSERTLEPYNEVFSLAKKLELGKCTQEDFKNIIFHIEQINYNYQRIKL